MPRVSVIIPSYNHEAFVGEAIQSVLDQTYQDFEIVITDDGSTDRTVDVIKTFADPRIRLFCFDTNRGAVVAVINCIQASTGEFIAILSSDDVFAPDKLEKEVAFLDQHPDVGAVFSYAEPIDEAGNRISGTNHFYENIFIQPNRTRFEWLNYFFFKENCLCHSSALIRRACYETVGLYDPSYAQLPDFDFWIRLCMAWEIHILPEELAKFRIRSNEANVSGSRLESRMRHEIELTQILPHYLGPFVRDNFARIFPDGQDAPGEGDQNLVPFLVARLAMRVERPAYQFFALQTLYQVFASGPATVQRIRERYAFEYADLIRRTGQRDVFNIGSLDQANERALQRAKRDRLVEELSAQAHERNRQIAALRDELDHQQHALDRQQHALDVARADIAARDQEVQRLRAIVEYGAQLRRELDAIKSSLGYRLLDRVVWPLSRRVLPFGLRSEIKAVLRRLKRTAARAPAPSTSAELVWGLDTDLSQPLVVGAGNALSLSGWCYAPQARIRGLSVLVDGRSYRVANHSLARPDLFEAAPQEAMQTPNRITSGFWVALPFEEQRTPREVALALRARLDDGTICEAAIGTLALQPVCREPLDLAVGGVPAAPGPLVAIGMATYNPPLDLFAAQVESIVKQTHQHWICIINDDCSDPDIFAEIERIAAQDERFVVRRNTTRLGFYHNFERCLALVPASADFVALADQDDYWYPDKLAACLAAFQPDTMLVYSDMDIVARDGSVISHTYWTARKNNYTDLEVLLFANTVTGAASLFRAGLLRDILPFPRRVGDVYHDHWIACIALVQGDIGYIDRPLYAYRQHTNNVIGHYVIEPHQLLPRARTLARALVSPAALKARTRSWLLEMRYVYFHFVIRLMLLARILQLRVGAISPEKRAVLARFAGLEQSSRWLIAQAIKYKLSQRPSLGVELYCLRAALGVRLLNLVYAWRRHQLHNQNLVGASGPATPRPILAEPPVGRGLDVSAPVELIPRKIAPLKLAVSERAPRRVNILIATVNFRYLFAGYMGMFNFALQLQRNGYQVRMVIVEECDYNLAAWRRELVKYDSLHDLLDRIETAYVFDRSNALEVSPNDAFIATSWWTAHIAHRAARELAQEQFVFLVQEYEAIFYPTSSLYALAEESYAFPHYAVFSTELLREYFKQHRLGVFSRGIERGERESVAFQNAVNSFQVSAQALSRRKRRKLLFYARPEQHAARNMFELGVLALREVIASGAFDTAMWEFHGIGAMSSYKSLRLHRGVELKLLPRVSLQEYMTLLPSYDLGLSLMLSPHPSMAPLDMAAAGLVTVTNTYANKTCEQLAAISPNIVPAAPTIAGISAALLAALGKVEQFEQRVAGARVNWSTSWEETFGGAVMAKLKEFIG